MALATNQYVGNADYRGYLSALAKGGDTNAQNALYMVGNDGKLNQNTLQNWASGPDIAPGQDQQRIGDITNYNNNQYATYQKLANSRSYSEADAQAAQDAQDRAAALFGIEQGITSADQTLGGLDRQYQIGQDNIGRDYSHELDILTGQRKANNARYDQEGVNQLNQYDAKRNQNDQSAAAYLTNGLRTLGAQGAGGGSAARYGLPYDAQSQATRANAGDQAVNTANMAAIASSRQQDEDKFTNSQNDLNYQRDQGLRDLESRINNTRAQTLATRGQLEGQRNIANGGDYRTAQAAAAPYTSRINALLNSITELSATPKFAAQQVTVGKPDLSGYAWNNPIAQPTPQQDVSLAGNNVNPVAALFGLNPDDQQKQELQLV